MPDSLETIKGLFDHAGEDEKAEYLLKGMILIRDEMRVSFDHLRGEIKKMDARCVNRRDVCDEVIKGRIKESIEPLKKKICDTKSECMTKTTAKVYGYIIMALSIGIALGSKAMSWTEVFKKVIP